MPLVAASLQAGLIQVFKDKKGMTPRLAAQKMAKAYNDYARTAMALTSTPVFTGMEVMRLEKILFGAISSPILGMPPILAAAWAAGVAAFWSTPPVPFTGAMTGAVMQAVTVIPIITPGLTACFSNLANTEESCALLMSIVLDAATHTVMVALAPPAGTTAPLL